MLIAKEQSDYTLIPEGTHRAVFSAVVSLGMQDNPYGKPKPQLLIRYEFPDFMVEHEMDGLVVSGPMVKWQFYTVSLHKEANLRRDLESWRDKGFTKLELKGFDVTSILGHACQVTIIHDHSGDRVKDKIRTVGKYMGNGDRPQPQLEIIRYTEDEIEQWELLPEFVQEKIRSQIKTEKDAVRLPVHVESDPFKDDAIPF